jgi:tetratricopeptide (TPR) repeat protein
MTGELNVAVAPFETDGKTTEEGVALARAVASVLNSELPRLDHSFHVEVRGPRTVGPIDGSDRESQAHSAKQLAHAIGADIVVYGELVEGPESTRLEPAFYLNAKKLPWAEGLAPRFAYGAPIRRRYPLAVSSVARAQIRTALIRRTNVYAQAFIGVGYYLAHRNGEAVPHLRAALAQAPTPSVAALMRLLLGNIADRRGQPARAARYYSLAASDSATRLRARLGQADVRYQTGHGQCQAGEVVWSQLSSARQGFAAVLRSLGGIDVAREGSTLAAKAAFGEGQVDLCLASAGRARYWSAVGEEFGATIAAYHATYRRRRPEHPELRDDAAEAHAGLALEDLALERRPASYEDALREYRAAARGTSLEQRRAYFDGASAFADVHLDRYGAAIREVRRGAEIVEETRLGRSLAQRAKKLRREEKAVR